MLMLPENNVLEKTTTVEFPTIKLYAKRITIDATVVILSVAYTNVSMASWF